jgi:hypothetical protein
VVVRLKNQSEKIVIFEFNMTNNYYDFYFLKGWSIEKNCLGNNVDSVGKISESANVFLECCRSGAPAVNFAIEDCDNQKRGRDSSNLKQLKMSIELIVVGLKK